MCESLVHQIEKQQMTIFRKLLHKVRGVALTNAADITCHKAPEKQPEQKEMSPEGKGKVRYVGGRAIAKTRKKLKSFLNQNLYKEGKKHRNKAKEAEIKMNLLRSQEIPYEKLLQTAKEPATLEAIRRKQNLTFGLTNINDRIYDFFIDLEEERRKLQTEMHAHTEGSAILQCTMNSVLENSALKGTWSELFDDIEPKSEFTEEICTEEINRAIESIYHMVVTSYMRVGNNQFRKDLKRVLAVKKTVQHRHAIFQKTQKSTTNIGSLLRIDLDEIKSDKSPNKIHSHDKIKAITVLDRGQLSK